MLYLMEKVLCRIQFKLLYRYEFDNLINFCQQHFGAVKALYDSSGGSSVSTSSSNGGRSLSKHGSHHRLPERADSRPSRVPNSSQPVSVSRMLAEVDSQANVIYGSSPNNETVIGTESLKILEDIRGPVIGEDFRLTETIMSSLLNETSFMKEVSSRTDFRRCANDMSFILRTCGKIWALTSICSTGSYDLYIVLALSISVIPSYSYQSDMYDSETLG